MNCSIKVFIFILCSSFWATITEAQYFEQKEGNLPIEKRYRAFFIKPVIGLIQSRVNLEGHDRFSKSQSPGDAYQMALGALLGYQLEDFTVDLGIIKYAIYSGFYFPSNTSIGGLTGINRGFSLGYLQFPLTAKYTVWKPAKKWQIRGVIGGQLNIRGQSFGFLKQSVEEAGSMTSTGARITIRSVIDKEFRSRFYSGNLGIDATYQLNNQFNVSVEVHRMFSQQDIGILKAEVTQNGDPATYHIKAAGSLNGLALRLGVAYNFLYSKVRRDL
ncbi:hypothetical protein GCM10028803_53170 [Larkinella knui]|uniref:Outer membrane protein beta-barrel domain-containing protein n=1 Tax=Larkinella knui TaxID=2025310 RepID=A0A3P1CGT8_9BACT|nr:hypothetical protein [Larkinella knui]RRB12477.1 hypothetical protein EHT87_19960 [Larkinella knui]